MRRVIFSRLGGYAQWTQHLCDEGAVLDVIARNGYGDNSPRSEDISLPVEKNPPHFVYVYRIRKCSGPL